MSSKTYNPRLIVDLDEDQFNRLQRLIPWGIKSKIMRIFISDLIDILETDRENSDSRLMGLLLSNRLRFTIEERGGDNGRSK